jgi:hypothetical protein
VKQESMPSVSLFLSSAPNTEPGYRSHGQTHFQNPLNQTRDRAHRINYFFAHWLYLHLDAYRQNDAKPFHLTESLASTKAPRRKG